MNSQQLHALSSLAGRGRILAAGDVLPLGRSGGDLEVLAGRVWLTQAGDRDDHVVESGQIVHVDGAGDAVIEAWGDGASARVAWQPRRPLQRAAAAVRGALARRG